MRSTKNAGTALQRLADHLGARLEPVGTGQRRATVQRDGWPPAVIEGRTNEVLYGLLYAALAPTSVGGLGYDMDEIKDRVRLWKVPTAYVTGAHQQRILGRLCS